MEWKPIESAPRDGTNILLFATPYQMLVAKNKIVVGYWSNGWWMDGPANLSHVTHWMPLPTAPTV